MKLKHQSSFSPDRDKGPVLRGRIFLKKSLICLKLTVLLALSVCISASAKGYSQNITLSAKNALLKNVFNEIQKQTGYEFIYTTEMLNQARPVNINVRNADIQQVLNICFKNQPFSYTLVDKTVAIRPTAQNTASADKYDGKQFAPPIDVRGRVVNEAGEPLAGASIQIKGSSGRSVLTDKDGMFSIKTDAGSELIISYVSFQSQTVKVSKPDFLTISLTPVINQLDQVTITGYTEYAKSKSPSATGYIGAKDINQVPMSSVDQILQGRVPGLNVTSSSGQPGQSASVVIRGIGSINGTTTPLYIMDGIPIEGGYFQTINPQDIESVTILKDASAKALYGSRGSNGVIVITTKRGKKGQLNVGYSSQYGFSNLTTPKFEMMDARERLKFEEEVSSELGRSVGPGWTYSPLNPNYATQSADWQRKADGILDSLEGVNTDWRDMFFQRGSFMEQQVNMSGGNEHVKAYGALGYWKQNGIVRETGLDRYSLRSNVDMNYGKFTGSLNVSLGYSRSRFTYNEGGTGVGSPMASVYYALPYEYPYTPDGVFHPADDAITFLDSREGSRGIDALYGVTDKTEQFKTILGVNLAYEIIKGLKISTRAGVDYRNSTDQTFFNPISYIGKNRAGGKGSFGEGSRRNYNLVSTSGITYKKRLNLHDFEVSGFFEYLYNNYRAFNYTGYGIDDRLPETPAGIAVSSTFLPALGGSRSASAMTSYMGVGRYTYNDKYTLTASYRYDGASLSSVPLKNRWQGFYSFGASWDAKKESFLEANNLISDLRVRASYGQTASPFSSSYAYLPLYEVSSSTTYGGQSTIIASTIGNPDFDWEYVDEFNAGFDLSLFQSQRLKLTFDFYNRITRNMFIAQPLSVTSGSDDPLPLSTGRMRNRGIEFSLSGDVIQGKDFSWNIGVNAGINQNRILRVSDVADELPDGDTRIIKVGYSYGTYYAPLWAGVDKGTGDALYYNRDGSVTNVYDATGQNVPKSGSMFPTLTGGITSSASWKNISVSALFSFVSNVQRWNNIDFYIENQRFISSNMSRRMLYERWKKPGDDALLQRIDVPRNFTSKDIQDASFLRLRNVKLNYSLSRALLRRTGIFKSANIFVQGENLFTWTSWRGLDPENNRQYGRFEYPNARTYTAGINLNF